MIATIDDNGDVSTPGTSSSTGSCPTGPRQTPVVASHVVLTPAQDSQVQYAMEADHRRRYRRSTRRLGLGGRQIIGKTGTTSNFHSGFFIGAIPQYALVVGMFANEQNTSNAHDSLAGARRRRRSVVTGRPRSGTPSPRPSSPTCRWRTSRTRVFTGSMWNMIGPLPKAKPKKKPTNKCQPRKFHGHQFPGTGPGCVTTTPTPTPTPTNTASGNPTSTPTGLPTTTATPTPTTSGSADPDVDRIGHADADAERVAHRLPVRRRRLRRDDGERRQGGPGRRRGARHGAARLAAVDVDRPAAPQAPVRSGLRARHRDRER